MVSPHLTKLIYETQTTELTGKRYCFYHGRHCFKDAECILKQDETAAQGRRVNIIANANSSRPGMGVKNTAYAKDLFEGSVETYE